MNNDKNENLTFEPESLNSGEKVNLNSGNNYFLDCFVSFGILFQE